MAKKKTSQQKRQKEPCEEDTSDEELKSYSSAKACSHIAKAVNLNRVKKFLKSNSTEKCKDCPDKGSEKVEKASTEDTLEEPSEVWLCLQCGYCGCGRTSTNKHAMLHYKTPRSDCHALVLGMSSMSVWCYMCDESVLLESSRSLRECVDFIVKNKDKKPPANVMVNGSTKGISKPIPAEVPAEAPAKPEKSTPNQKGKQNDSSSSKNTGASGKKSSVTNSKGVKGLANLGNTCFFNSILQNMCQTPWLLQELEQRSEKGYMWEVPFLVIDNEIVQNPENSKVPLLECGQLTLAFCNTLKQMKKPSQDNKHEIVNPSHLFDQICRKSPQFRGNHQQDSHECLRHLLDGIRNEEIKRQKKGVLRKFKLEKANPDEVDENTKQLMKAYGNFASHTVVERIFGGQLMSTVVCEECKMSSQVFEPFMDLSLPLAEEKVMRSAKGHKPGSDEDLGIPTVSKRQNTENTLSKHQERKLKQQAKKAAKKKAKMSKSGSRTIQLEEGQKDEVVAEGVEDTSKTQREENCPRVENASSIDGNDDDDKDDSNHEQSDADVEDNDESETVLHNLREQRTNSLVPEIEEVDLSFYEEDPDCEIIFVSEQLGGMKIGEKQEESSSSHCCANKKGCVGKADELPSNQTSLAQEAKACENCESCTTTQSADATDTSVQFHCCSIRKHKPTEQSDADVEDNDESETVMNKLCCSGKHDPDTVPSPADVAAGDGKAIDSRIEELCDQITDVRVRQESDRQEDFLGCMDDDEVSQSKEKRPRSSHNSISEETGTDEWSHHLTKEWVRQSLTTLKARYQPSSLECSVNSCLNQFTASELLTGSNKFRCENCTSQRQKATGDDSVVVYSNASKQLLIFSPPAVLTLHLKRFQQTGASLRKLNLFVEFPEVLDLAPYCSSICLKLPHMSGVKDEVLYSLYGVVQHSGRLSSGHYTAYVRVGDTHINPSFVNAWPTNHCNLEQFLEKVAKFTENNSITTGPPSSAGHKWYYVSDSFFKEVSVSEVLQCQAYILFYQRIK